MTRADQGSTRLPPAIRRAVVIGAGTMGAQIAAHLANAGVRATLLDVIPQSLTEAETAAGQSLDDRPVRDRIVRAGLERARRARPAAFFSPRAETWITIGNLDDDFEAVAEADWIVEAVIEQLEPKRALMARIDALRRDDALVSTNTSGIPVSQIADGRSASFRSHFLGTHFFNPPRYLKLLELIPTPDTEPEVMDFFECFGQHRLGKGVVRCKDTPNFIANRLGSVGGAFVLDFALQHGYSVEEVDALTGPLIGRPKTATFRLLDLVGSDVSMGVRRNLAQALPQDQAIPYLSAPEADRLAQTMLDRGWLGNKTGQGFYKTVPTEDGKEFWPLNLKSLEYEAPAHPRFEGVAAVKDLPTPVERIQALLAQDDRAGEFVKNVTYFSLAYASYRVPEIADTPAPIDDAVRWGFNHELGPFELWDALGVAKTSAAMREAGYEPAAWVTAMLNRGVESFYKLENDIPVAVYDPKSGTLQSRLERHGSRSRSPHVSQDQVMESNAGASLLDLGDGVAGLRMHAQGNALDEDVLMMLDRSLARVEAGFAGLVIDSQADDFSFGANLMVVALAAQNGLWDQLETAIRTLQALNQRLQSSSFPVVVAAAGRALGGGCEIIMHASRVVAAAETYIGLVEVGAGLIPAGGGCKEVLRRRLNPFMSVPGAQALPALQAIFETVGQAKVGTSAEESADLGYLGPADRVVMNRDELLAEAKQEVLHLARDYRPPVPAKIYAAGRDALAALQVGVFMFREAGALSEYDAHIGHKLAGVLTGGELSQPAWVEPAWILDLEREAFLSLAGEAKTQARMWHVLQTGKGLRN